MDTLHAALTIPATEQLMDVAESYVRRVAELAGFPEDHAVLMAEFAGGVCRQISQFSAAAGTAAVSLQCDVSPTELALALIDHGLPLGRAQELKLSAGARGRSRERAPGAATVGRAFDHAHWLHLGPGGTELRLIKQRPRRHVRQHLSEEQLRPFDESAEPAAEQVYSVRKMRPAEAIGVAQCIYRSYGNAYVNPDFYFPDSIVHLNHTGQLYSAVAVTEDGEVVGHAALERPNLGRVAEVGAAVVNPAHRHHRLLERLRDCLEAHARRIKLVGIYGQPVTVHTYSQRAERDAGGRPVGFSLGISPPRIFTGITSSVPPEGRLTDMLYYKPFQRPGSLRVYAPSHHQPMLAKLYAQFDTQVEFHPGSPPDGSTPQQLEVQFQAAAKRGIIRVGSVGTDTPAAIIQARHDLTMAASAEVVFLDLPLADPGTPSACIEAEAAGFFCGLGPQFAESGDTIRLQHIDVEIDGNQLQVLETTGQELLAYILEQRGRATASA